MSGIRKTGFIYTNKSMDDTQCWSLNQCKQVSFLMNKDAGNFAWEHHCDISIGRMTWRLILRLGGIIIRDECMHMAIGVEWPLNGVEMVPVRAIKVGAVYVVLGSINPVQPSLLIINCQPVWPCELIGHNNSPTRRITIQASALYLRLVSPVSPIHVPSTEFNRISKFGLITELKKSL